MARSSSKELLWALRELHKTASRVKKAFRKYGPVDDGRPEGEEFEDALTELGASSNSSPGSTRRI